MIRNVVERTRRACSRIILICGYRGKELERLFSPYSRVVCVRNTAYRRGMFSSIQTGAALVETEWFFIALGDMPAVPPELFRRLAAHIDLHPEADVIRPVFRNTPGHPVLLRRSVAGTIGEMDYKASMQDTFAAHEKKTGQGVFNLSVDDIPECIYDIDTDDDLSAADTKELPGSIDYEEEK